MELNKVHHLNFLENTLPDKSATLIIGDPPYYRVKGSFDFIWKSFDDYLKDVELWALECQRLISDNGTLFWYGSAKNIAYAQVIFDKYFTLINSIVWDKGNFMGLEESEGLRSLAACTERILMYGSQAQDLTGLQAVEKEYVAPRNPFAIELKRARKQKGVSIKDVAEYGKFYGNVNHGGAVTNWEAGYNIPSKEQWEKICEFLPIDRKDSGELLREYESIRAEYEAIRKEYEGKRRYFNNSFKLQEVFRFSNEAGKTGAKYDHETPKPEKMTRAIILSCSRPGDLVVVPFSGSGTECAMSSKEGRQTIGFDIDGPSVEESNKRLNIIKQKPELFTF